MRLDRSAARSPRVGGAGPHRGARPDRAPRPSRSPSRRWRLDAALRAAGRRSGRIAKRRHIPPHGDGAGWQFRAGSSAQIDGQDRPAQGWRGEGLSPLPSRHDRSPRRQARDGCVDAVRRPTTITIGRGDRMERRTDGRTPSVRGARRGPGADRDARGAHDRGRGAAAKDGRRLPRLERGLEIPTNAISSTRPAGLGLR